MPADTLPSAPTKADILERNRLEYDDADDLYWRLTVYDAVHGGWQFASIGGRAVLDVVGARAQSFPRPHVLELCSGAGAPCVYVADTFGCRATGIEINRHQVARAHAALERRAPRSAAVRVIEGDVLAWTPDDVYHVVFGVDALMLLEDRRAALRTARAALAAGGSAVFGDVLAGPAITDRVRRFIWVEDGIVDLPTEAQQRRMLEDVAFADVEMQDLTGLAARCFDTVAEASRRHEAVLVAAKGRARYERWLGNACLYADHFGRRELVYTLITAR